MSSAIITAHKLGTTKIIGRCLLKNPINGKDEVVSEDSVEVRVVALTGVQVRTPLVRIRSGAVMPATLWGQPDLSPMVLGTLENMRTTWTVNQADVVEIFNVFTTAGKSQGLGIVKSRCAEIPHCSAKLISSMPTRCTHIKCSTMSLHG